MIRRLDSAEEATKKPPDGMRGSSADGEVASNDRSAARLEVPPRVLRQVSRPAQTGVPGDKSARDRLRYFARRRVEQENLVPPLTLEELREHAGLVCAAAGVTEDCADYAVIVVNNEAWRDTLAGIPFDRRLLLLPKCLRADGRCPAPIDEFGLVCQSCGSCLISELQSEAEQLGYAVLVAEGSAVVTKMIEAGRIEAVVGVSCMSVLEKCFPHMEARAVPGVAVPLLQDGCANTTVDVDWIRDAMHLTKDDRTYRLDLDALKTDVQNWFAPESLTKLLGTPLGETEAIARDWLARAGKRWRPYLAACVYVSLQGDGAVSPHGLPDDLKKLAIAVECFHKASLVHDDIEDGDEQRYGFKALHVECGTPVALNVGDFLLGEGYRLVGELDVDDGVKVAMLQTAAGGHLTLSRGQGAELCWTRHPQPMSTLEVLDIFRQKTAPAFEVALRLGAFYGGADAGVHDVLVRYSEALGIAYQIRDDLEDFAGVGDSNDLRDLRPSVVLAIAHKRAAEGADRGLTTALWRRECDYEKVAGDVRRLTDRCGVIETVENLLEAYTAQANRSLHPLRSPTLKGLLRRVIGRIFGNEQIPGYCDEFEARHAGRRPGGAEPAV